MSIEVHPEVEVDIDPFRYGSRFVRHERADGEVEYEEVPLRPIDLLFPEESDHPVHHPDHVYTCLWLLSVFTDQMAAVPRSLVLCDCRVDYAIPGISPIGPDLSVFLDVPDLHPRATFDQARQNARPALAVEVTSPDTRPNDFGIKKGIYQLAGVETYVIIDFREIGERQVRTIHGFRNTPDGYEPIPLDDRGWLRVEVLNLDMAIIDGQVACFDATTGHRFPRLGELGQALRTAEARVEEERQRAEAAQTLADEERQRAEEERWKAEEERQRADEERLRAETAQARADAERTRAGDLEAQLRAMREEIERLRGGG